VRRSSFIRNQRGQATLLVLLLVTLLLYAAMAQFQLVLVAIKAGGSLNGNLAKDRVLVNAVHQVRLYASGEEGDFTYRDTALAYRHIHVRPRDLDLDQVVVRSEEHAHWPVVTGFWVQGDRFNLYLVDYRTGGTP